ncbi:protein mono-ADP-ribosyltransferase PARP9 [Pseudophryne corroboree]|uniref:protein mono-ADP-ribosyltransferase PARP9 n=1 Tax=Pseudophryne corroboree TaxID=495146 RepID=UPI003081F922
MEAQKKVTISEDTCKHLHGCLNELNDLLIRKFNCSIELKGPKPGTSAAVVEKPLTVYEKRFFQKKVLVSVWKDDMTRQNVDTVVNAANDKLDHIGGLALALANAGGPRITQESKDHIYRYGKLNAGDIAVTSGGNLPCRAIIHAVGPMWYSGTAQKCEYELQKVIKEVLDYVNKHKDLTSVAIPAISSGIFGFPLDLCAQIIVDTVRAFIFNAAGDHMKEIRLVNHDDKTVQAMKSACEQKLGPSDPLSGATSVSPYPTSSHANQISHQPETPSRRAPAPNTPQPIAINGLNLHLKYGLIEEEKTTVIVNSVASNLDLTNGEITKAILRKAGQSIQDEIRRKRSYSATMIPTRGYNLLCDFVYNVILQQSYAQSSDHVLSQVTEECLTTAQKYGSPSISFPALGTGNIGLSRQTAAKVMTQAVVNFARKSRSNMNVYFVIYPKDKDTFKAFEEEFSRVNSGKNTENRAEGRGLENWEKKKHFADDETCLLIGGPHMEDIEAAAAFLDNVVHSQPVVIRNNHIILFGIKEHDVFASPDFPNVSIHEELENGAATLKIEGPPEKRVKAAVLVERLLLDAQEKHAETLEEELVEAAVIWSYENKTGSYRYSAKANREIERAYVTQSSSPLEVEPGHVIDIKNRTADSKDGTWQLLRRCIREDSKSGPKAPRSGAWLSVTEVVKESSQEFNDRSNEFRKASLTLVKMEKVQNQLLSTVYESKKEAIEKTLKKPSTQLLYQLVDRGVRKQICDVGFQRLYVSPNVPDCGVGIYFKKTLSNIVRRFKASDEKGLIYIIQAEVLTGTSAKVSHKQPVTPLPTNDKLEPYDSLTDNSLTPEHCIIFNCFHARPVYLFTCKCSDAGRG